MAEAPRSRRRREKDDVEGSSDGEDGDDVDDDDGCVPSDEEEAAEMVRVHMTGYLGT